MRNPSQAENTNNSYFIFQILLLGLVQTVVESCMYIFVFLWTPMLAPENPPLGMVFACFMVTIMIGSSTYTLLLARGVKAEAMLRITLALISASMALCILFGGPSRPPTDTVVLYGAFLVLEIAIGMYFPAMSFLRSQVIPESHRANVMNWFRVPMNIITCLTLLSLNLESIKFDKRLVFAFCFGLATIGIYIVTTFMRAMEKVGDPQVSSKKVDLLIENDAKGPVAIIDAETQMKALS